jgi:hypothetical protein
VAMYLLVTLLYFHIEKYKRRTLFLELQKKNKDAIILIGARQKSKEKLDNFSLIYGTIMKRYGKC